MALDGIGAALLRSSAAASCRVRKFIGAAGGQTLCAMRKLRR